jgi:hypothetical protein
MKINVEGTHIIKLGLAIFDANGESLGIWELNFRDFDLNIHSHNTESIELLKKKGFFFFRFSTKEWYRLNGIRQANSEVWRVGQLPYHLDHV